MEAKSIPFLIMFCDFDALGRWCVSYSTTAKKNKRLETGIPAVGQGMTKAVFLINISSQI